MDKPSSKNAERLRKYRSKMTAAGFKRFSFYICAELDAYLLSERKPYECGGRTLERLLLGEAANRPDYWTAEEKIRRQNRANAVRRKFGMTSP